MTTTGLGYLQRWVLGNSCWADMTHWTSSNDDPRPVEGNVTR